MTNLQIRKAERKQTKLRVGLSGPSGSGKTYSALLVAFGITQDWSKVALIDTESGSGELYSDFGEYNVITLEAPFSPERYIEAIELCENSGVEVIIIDSTSHEWDGKGGCLEANELLGQTKFRGNTWAAWSVTTPRHRQFIQKIISSSSHIITTARSKTDTIQTEDKKVKKVGLKEIQREGFEYELTSNFTLDREGHYAIASKDRTGIFSESDPFIITKETGKTLIDWVKQGKEVVIDYTVQKNKIIRLIEMLDGKNKNKTADDYQKSVLFHSDEELEPEKYDVIIDKLEILVRERKEAMQSEDNESEQQPVESPEDSKTTPKTTKKAESKGKVEKKKKASQGAKQDNKKK